MALYFGFYDSYNHDRQYNSKDFGRMFDGVITDGVFSTVGEILATIPGEGLNVIVKSGKAWFNRTWTFNDGFVTLPIDLPDVLLPRYDAIVLEIDQDVAVRENKFKVIKGSPATEPVKPTLTNTETLHQYPLAYIRVNANASSFTTTNIDIRVGKTDCPFCTPVQTVDITDLYNNWEGQFQEWFDNVKTSLEGDVALNLQRQIDELNTALTTKLDKTTDRATTAEAITGSSNTKWMSPAAVNNVFQNRQATVAEISAGTVQYKYISPYMLVQSNASLNNVKIGMIVVHSSKTVTKPTGLLGDTAFAILVGAGGGGGGSIHTYDKLTTAGAGTAGGGGGGGGYINSIAIRFPAKFTIGTGGTSGIDTILNYGVHELTYAGRGGNGGSTTVEYTHNGSTLRFSASGGSGGSGASGKFNDDAGSSSSTVLSGGSGGSGYGNGGSGTASKNNSSNSSHGGSGGFSYGFGGLAPYSSRNPLMMMGESMPFYGGGGSGRTVVYTGESSYAINYQTYGRSTGANGVAFIYYFYI